MQIFTESVCYTQTYMHTCTHAHTYIHTENQLIKVTQVWIKI